MNEKITSTANQRVKYIQKLKTNNHFRQQENFFTIEGYREIHRAIVSGIQIAEIYLCKELNSTNRQQEILKMLEKSRVIEIGENVFAHLAYRETSDGLLALAIPQKNNFSDIKLSANPLALVLESVEKPGNLGAIMRTCDAARVDVVIVCNPLTDIYNPNAIRAALGCMFALPIVVCKTHEAINWLKTNNIKIYAAALTDTAQPYYEQNYTQPVAFVMGTEASGLSMEWLAQSDQQLIIPMRGIADSLNVGISAAVLIFEALRQRESR